MKFKINEQLSAFNKLCLGILFKQHIFFWTKCSTCDWPLGFSQKSGEVQGEIWEGERKGHAGLWDSDLRERQRSTAYAEPGK